MIEFLCPNGHKINCPDEQAGRGAKCPKCGARFRIPHPTEVEARHAAGSDSDISEPELTDSGIAPFQAGRVEPVEKEPQIEFLCPNGHRLHGPASLQGKPGQCPECGSKFRIPIYDDIQEEEEMEQGLGVGRADGGVDSDLARPQTIETIEEIRDVEEISAAEHSTAALFERFWAEKPDNGHVELHLPGGEILTPDRFVKPLSTQSHGVFAVKESAGTYTLTAVAWDSVVRMVVRGVKNIH